MKIARMLLLGAALAFVLGGCGEDDKEAFNAEGSVASPITLNFGVTHPGQVGGSPGNDSSYYLHQATSTGTHTITLSSFTQNLAWYSGVDSSFGAYTNLCNTSTSGSGTESCTAGLLSNGAAYFIRVFNWDFTGTTFNIVITAP